MKVGLTGGIGAGKSTVADLFSKKGAVIIRADQLARQVIEHDSPGFQKVVALFGPEIVDQDQNINRTKLAQIVFNNDQALKDLENIIDENIEMRNKTNNIIFITSIINCCNKPLSYYHIRSVFDVKTRFLQTLKTIESIRLKIPNSIIFLFPYRIL